MKLGNLISNAFVRQVFKLSSVSVLSNLLGFAIPIYIGYAFGVSEETDDFFLSYSIIMFVTTIFSGAVKTVMVPFLIDIIENRAKFTTFVSTIFSYSFKYIGFLVLLIILTSALIYWQTSIRLYLYLAISAPILFFSIKNSICFGVLNSLKQFILAETSPFTRSLVIILFVYLFHDSWGLLSVIVGFNVGEGLKFVHLWYVLKVRNKLDVDLKTFDLTTVKHFFAEGGNQILSTSIISSSQLIDKLVASFLVVGSISVLDYGNRLFVGFNVIFSSFLVVLLSKWSTSFKKSDFAMSEINRVIKYLFALSFGLVVAIYFSKDFIISILYPNIPIDDRIEIAYILFINSIGFVFNSSNQVINRATIVTKATRILINISIFKSVLNLVLNIVFAYFFGVIGIAVSTVFVHLFGFVLNYVLLKNKLMAKVL
jgi:putative peptidoglycan lipid II flippase